MADPPDGTSIRAGTPGVTARQDRRHPGRAATALVACAWVAVLGGGLVIAASTIAAPPRMYAPHDAPARPLAVVLGAPPGPMLDARLDAACALVQLNKTARLLVTGLPLEIPVMVERARRCLPAEAVLVDPAAPRTLENLRRARDHFGASSVLIVTQEFHMPRALYLARALGLDAAGVLAQGPAAGPLLRLRERVAHIRAHIDVALLDSPGRDGRDSP